MRPQFVGNTYILVYILYRNLIYAYSAYIYARCRLINGRFCEFIPFRSSYWLLATTTPVLPLKSLSCIRLWGPTFLIFLRRLNQRTLTWTDHPSAAKASASFSTLPLKGRRVARGKARSKRPSSIRHLTAAEILLRIINALWYECTVKIGAQWRFASE